MQYMVKSLFLTMILLNSYSGNMPKQVKPVTIRVIYDNNPYDSHLKPEWGFSCFIQGTEKTILFDTGGSGATLLSNMEKLKIKPEQVDLIFLSHNHSDHTGGLIEFLKNNNKVIVFLPQSFPSRFKKDIENSGAQYIEVKEPIEICKDVCSPGELGFSIKEQSLLIKTGKGLVVITGCAHPGIVEIVKKAKKLLNEDIYLILGGFHMLNTSEKKIKETVLEFEKLGVKKVAPCHCSGELCQKIFEDLYKQNFIKLGVGGKVKVE
jgi:7,8-dihydropterin-6-yl-methyl-4-(beta-D-ribofuranosyl)aminobenzene 5'-phosphate synthase